ncbi:MAG: CHAT domain-containing protein [Haliscomenobacteraceae bacterium CHB4]|nr:CHAT domain-containing protein [Haliscomenobacteraceae bacterium CHB4]
MLKINNLTSRFWSRHIDRFYKPRIAVESLNTFEKALGKEHPDYAWSLNNLASLYLDMGNYEKAQPLYVEALTVYEKVLGKEHPEYALSLTGLANVYWEMDNYEKAKPLYLEALVIREKVLGKVHPEYARSLSNLALLYKSMGNNEKAELYYLEALTIKEKVLGKEHPDYALNLNNLANLYSSMGNYQKAEPLFVEALVIREKTLGKEHPDYSMNLNNLVVLYWSVGNFDTVKPYLSESATIEKKLLLKASRQLSERELSKYINTFTGRQNRELSFSQLRGGVSPICYDNILFHKGFMLNTVSQVSKLALSDSVTTEKYYLLKSYHRRLATQYILPIAERDSTLIATLEEKANNLEKELVRTVAGFGEALRQVNWQEVQSRLKPHEAAIEFVHFRYSNPEPTDSTLHAALVLRPGWNAPRWVFLCEEKQLDALLDPVNTQRTEYLNRLYTPAQPSVVVRDDEPPALYDLVWAPLDSLLGSVKTVYYSPSGLLHRLNLGAIPVSEKQTLADRYALRQVNSTRELVIPSATATATATVFGGIRYEMDSTAICTAFVKKDGSTAKSSSELSFSYIDRSLRPARRSRSGGRDGSWSYLPGTEKETTEISKLLNKKGFRTIVKTGFAASEEVFKQIGRDGQPSPRVLHIATHGFFFPDPQSTIRNQQSAFRNQEPAFKVSEHPLIRSGLILSGGNAAWTNQSRPAGLEDGILTAYEISQMNLRNTELVVLSACETGLGDIEGNEGVYGLQRAFKIAGAKYLLMSLWKVPDQQTQELMTAFYREWTGGKAIPEAFRSAQATMRKKYPGQPAMWAGFMLVE